MDDPTPDRAIERGETYEHKTHGQVKVTGIWQGVQRVDTARDTNETDVIIVRFATDDDEPVTELTDTLNGFIEAID